MVPWTLQVEKPIVVLAELGWLEDLGLFLQVLQCQAWLINLGGKEGGGSSHMDLKEMLPPPQKQGET